MYRKYTYKLYPTTKQLKALEHILGVHQRLYNKALEDRITQYKEHKRSLSFQEQCLNLTK
jgi:putative transposase